MSPSDRLPLSPEDDERELERLLDAAGEVDVPPGLVEGVQRSLAASRADLRLERLLERVPPPGVPAGLAGRVLERLAERRAAAPGVTRVLRPVRRAPRRFRTLFVAATAAAVALALGLFVRARRLDGPASGPVAGTGPSSTEEIARAPGALAADDELLLALDALENWELLTSEDLDLLLAGLDTSEELLLELETAEPEGAPSSDAPDASGTLDDEPRNG